MARRSTENIAKRGKKRASAASGVQYPSFRAHGALFIVGIALTPLSAGLARTLLAAEKAFGRPSILGLSDSAGMFTLGFLAFAVLYAAIRIPALPYVFGHELTHVIFGLFKGARISGFNAKEQNGSVKVTRQGVLVLLSPYFFPIYLVVLLAVFGVLSTFAPMIGTFGGKVFAGLSGVAWSFHFCFTLNGFLQRQTDLEAYGFFFSCSLVVMLNLLCLCMVFVAISPIGMWDMLVLMGETTSSSVLWIWDGLWQIVWPSE